MGGTGVFAEVLGSGFVGSGPGGRQSTAAGRLLQRFFFVTTAIRKEGKLGKLRGDFLKAAKSLLRGGERKKGPWGERWIEELADGNPQLRVLSAHRGRSGNVKKEEKEPCPGNKKIEQLS